MIESIGNIVIIIFLLSFAIYGIRIIIKGIMKITKTLNKSFKEVEGKIVSSKSERVYDDYINHPIIEYYVENQKYTFISNGGSNLKQKIGKRIQLKYNTQNPEEVYKKIDDTAIYSIIIGIILLGVSGFSIIKYLSFSINI